MHRQAIDNIILTVGIVLSLCVFAHSQDKRAAQLFMSNPEKLLSSDDFETNTVADRWGIRAFYSVENGVLKRTSYRAAEAARAFLKDAVYHDAIIRFDFRFNGATEIRLMTGGGGGYNTVTQIFPGHFQVNTAKRKDEFDPSFQGECAFQFRQGKWYTMTVEFIGNEVVAHIDGEHFVVGNHPIIDTERTYLAFQVNGGSASFDNFALWSAGVREDWKARRGKYLAEQKRRKPAFMRNAKEEYDLIYLNLRDRLKRTDATYRDLVSKVDELEEKMKLDFSSANQTHKELSKKLAAAKKELKKTNSLYQKLEQELNQARRDVKNYVHTLRPELDEMPKQIYYWKYEECLNSLADDPELIELIRHAGESEATLHKSFPAAFQDISVLVEKRKQTQIQLKSNEEYSLLKKQIAEARKAVEDYLFSKEPKLAELSDGRMAIIRSKK